MLIVAHLYLLSSSQGAGNTCSNWAVKETSSGQAFRKSVIWYSGYRIRTGHLNWPFSTYTIESWAPGNVGSSFDRSISSSSSHFDIFIPRSIIVLIKESFCSSALCFPLSLFLWSRSWSNFFFFAVCKSSCTSLSLEVSRSFWQCSMHVSYFATSSADFAARRRALAWLGLNVKAFSLSNSADL